MTKAKLTDGRLVCVDFHYDRNFPMPNTQVRFLSWDQLAKIVKTGKRPETRKTVCKLFEIPNEESNPLTEGSKLIAESSAIRDIRDKDIKDKGRRAALSNLIKEMRLSKQDSVILWTAYNNRGVRVKAAA